MKNKWLTTALCALSMTVLTASAAPTQFKPDAREKLPAFFNHSYAGFGAGYTNIPFSNKNLIAPLNTASSFTNPSLGLNVYLGHFFNKYLAGQISLMRPVKWAYANGVSAANDKHSIWVSVFGFTLRPTYPITNRISIYGQAGLGIVSRHGFKIANKTAIPSADLFTALTGAGLTYAMGPHWHLNLGLEYSAPRTAEHQPGMLYTYGSFYYLFTQQKLPSYYDTHYIFHKNLVQLGGYSADFWHPKINKYFTVGYLPIFWAGDLKVQNAVQLKYNRNIYHTHRWFSFDLGTSISTYHSKKDNTSFQAFSVYPSFRFWLVRSKKVDFYVLYSIAGPTYLTHRHIDNLDLGGRFTFQDLLGIGFNLGSHKNANISFTLGHYSNGNLLPNNPGIEVPLVISAGWAFD